MGQFLTVPVAVVLAAALVATVTDLWRYKLYNILTLQLLVSGLVWHSLAPSPPALGLGGSLLGFAFGFGLLLVFHLLGGVGGGDVKLMAAVGAWLGLPLTFGVFLARAQSISMRRCIHRGGGAACKIVWPARTRIELHS